MPIYLDNSATTPVREEVINAMLPYLRQDFGNPSSPHEFGRKSKKALDKAREQVAKLLNCDPDEVYFSPCGTMSNNVALMGRARFVEANGLGKHLITTLIEHPSVLGPAKYLESQGWEVTFLPVDREGLITLTDLEKAVKKETSIISIMWANNEIGAVQPIAEVAEFALTRKIFMHTDAVQAPGKVALNMKQVPVSALALSGHKFHAPKGIGILYLRRAQNVMPITFGGGQEMGFMPGTEGIANIVAIGQAAELAQKELSATQEKLRRFQKTMIEKLSANEKIRLTGPQKLENRLPGHVSLLAKGLEGEALVMRADLKGLAVSSGSACHKGIIEPSHVLLSLGYGREEAMGSLRISASGLNTQEECDNACRVLAEILSGTSKPAAALIE